MKGVSQHQRELVLYGTRMGEGLQVANPGRREAKRQMRRSEIIAVARRWFAERGYAATILSDIARELGGSKRTLWAHFSGKAELFAAVVDDLAATIKPLALDLGDGELRAELERFAASFVQAVTSPDALLILRLVAAESGRFPELASTFWDRGPRITRRNVAAFLFRRMAAGELRSADPLTAAVTLLNLISAEPQQALLWGLEDGADDAALIRGAREAVDLFLRAYAGAEPAGDQN